MLGKTSNVVLMCVLCVCAQFSLERHGQWTFKKFFLHCVWILALFFPSFQLLFEIITTIIYSYYDYYQSFDSISCIGTNDASVFYNLPWF